MRYLSIMIIGLMLALNTGCAALVGGAAGGAAGYAAGEEAAEEEIEEES